MDILLILSSKLISDEMKDLFGNIPSSLIPVSNKTLLELIYEKNKEKYDKIIVTGKEKIELIEETIKNKKMDIEIVELDKLQDIGYSIYKSLIKFKEKDIKNLTINFADTYYSESLKLLKGRNVYLIGETSDSERWATFQINDGKMTIYDKKDIISKNDRYSVLAGIFNFINFKNFFEILDKIISDEDYEKGEKDRFYKTIEKFYENLDVELLNDGNNWIDYGHFDYYHDAKKEVDARSFNTIQVDRKKGILTKKSEHKEKLIKEIQWYLKLPKSLEYISPRIFDYSLSYTDPYVSMEYYSYGTLHEMFIYGDYSLNTWKKIFNRLLEINQEFKSFTLTLEKSKVRKSLKDMYYKKTIDRLKELKKDSRFEIFFDDEIVVNDKKIKALGYIIPKLEEIIEKNELLETENYNIIHGDYFFANILYDKRNNIVRLIDPRGNFGGYGIYGDNNYELAKLLHSVDGKYDLIVEDLFEIKNKNGIIDYKIFYSSKQENIKELFYEELKKYKLPIKKIKLIESLLFISMVPLHGDYYNRQLLMLSQGLEKINQFI
jgi:capsular polysaccharide biosynthesis protein